MTGPKQSICGLYNSKESPRTPVCSRQFQMRSSPLLCPHQALVHQQNRRIRWEQRTPIPPLGRQKVANPSHKNPARRDHRYSHKPPLKWKAGATTVERVQRIGLLQPHCDNSAVWLLLSRVKFENVGVVSVWLRLKVARIRNSKETSMSISSLHNTSFA